MPHPPIRIAVAAALATATLALASSAAAAPPATVADALATNWADRQNGDGSFPDSLRPTSHGWGRYGEAGMGYGLILAGVRTGREDLAQRGARAQLYAIEHAPDRSSVFESMLLASGYNQLRLRAPATPAFAQRRAEWEGYLRTIAPLFDASIAEPYLSSNKYLVEAVLDLELARSGLRSRTPGATLSDPRAARRRALDVINRLVPQRVRMLRAEAAGQRITALSDRYAQPAAYHALVLGFLARAIDLAGPRAHDRARESLRTGVRTTWAFQAPDGDLAYFGRSQGQAWALAASAFAAERAAGPSCDRQARALLAVEDRAMARIDARHPIGPNGMPVVPSANGPASVKAIDKYASDVVYNGLTLTMLGWAADGTVARPGCTPGRLLADRARSGARFPFELARFATARRGRVWMAVKQRSQRNDPRAAFGLRALKYRADDRSWIDLIPGAPIDAGAPGSTLGPSLVRRRRHARAARGRAPALHAPAAARRRRLGDPPPALDPPHGLPLRPHRARRARRRAGQEGRPRALLRAHGRPSGDPPERRCRPDRHHARVRARHGRPARSVRVEQLAGRLAQRHRGARSRQARHLHRRRALVP